MTIDLVFEAQESRLSREVQIRLTEDIGCLGTERK